MTRGCQSRGPTSSSPPVASQGERCLSEMASAMTASRRTSSKQGGMFRQPAGESEAVALSRSYFVAWVSLNCWPSILARAKRRNPRRLATPAAPK
jgi:hypothetical protein